MSNQEQDTLAMDYQKITDNRRLLMDRYIDLELQYNKLLQANAVERVRARKIKNSAEMRKIRKKQNDMYELLQEAKCITELQEELGFTNKQTLYQRWRYSIKEAEKKEESHEKVRAFYNKLKKD